MCQPKGFGGNTKSGRTNMVSGIRHVFRILGAEALEDSDVIYLNLLGQDIIVLNSLAACKELFDKRSAIYSSRPNMPMINDLCAS